MVIFGIKTCDTCRKALKTLEGARLHDVREEGFPPGLLERAAKEFGMELLNTRSATWRALSADERERPMLDLLTANPVVMKRPLIEADGNLYLGWSETTRKALGVS